MTLRTLTTPAAIVAALTLMSAPAWAGQRDRQSNRSGQQGGRSADRSQGDRSQGQRSGSQRADAPRSAPRQEAATPRSEPRRDAGAQRSEPRRDAGAQRGEPRRDAGAQRGEPRRDAGAQRGEPRRDFVQPRFDTRRDSVAPRYQPRNDRGYEPRYAPRFDSRYAPRYNAPRYSYSYRPHYLYRQPYLFRPWFTLGFGIYAGYPVPYTYAYSYPVYGYSAPVEPVIVGPGSTAYGGASLDIRPSDAQVYVDGGLAGEVSDFDGAGEPLTLASGTHRIEIVAPGYETLTIDANVQPGQIIPYRGELRRLAY
jgi:hypothetical protein